jgi:hypothetical protein
MDKKTIAIVLWACEVGETGPRLHPPKALVFSMFNLGVLLPGRDKFRTQAKAKDPPMYVKDEYNEQEEY